MSSIIECRGLTKRFGGTVALDSVTAAVTAGTVHALVGENGAGKSTLGKVLAGVHQPDDGGVFVDGQQVQLRSPRDALSMGIAMVAQELSLVPARSVMDNVFLGQEPTRRGVLDTGRARRRFTELATRYEIDLDPTVRVDSLSVAQQQRVEILRGLARDARVLIMDEPTARLSRTESDALLTSLKALTEQGVTVVYVSHFLDEVLELSDNVTVMRNGQVIRSGPTADEDRTSLVEGITGSRMDAAYPARATVADDATVVLRLNNLSRSGEFEDVSLEVKAGEIVTLAGLVGSGRTEVARVVFGANESSSGTMELAGRPYKPSAPHQAIAADVGMIPESRRTEGLLMQRPVSDNVSLPHLRRFSKTGVVDGTRERREVSTATDNVQLTGATIATPMFGLSGGNQQKSLFARWMIDPPKLLLADEPTRGVDVGSKRAIYDLMVEMAEQGMAILAISSEIDEVLGISNRIIVMREGRVVGELDGASATDSELMALAFGLDEATQGDRESLNE